MFGFGMYEAIIDIYVGDHLTNSEHMQAPDVILQMQFMNIVQQLSQDKSRPMSVRMTVPYNVEGSKKRIMNYVEYSNYEREYEDE